MSKCRSKDVDVVATLHYQVCLDHGHGRMTGSTVQSDGIHLADAVMGLCSITESAFLQLIGTDDFMQNFLNREYQRATDPTTMVTLDEEDKVRIGREFAHRLFRIAVEERMYPTNGNGAMISI